MWLSIQGWYEYDPDIMSGFNVPNGVNRNDAINDIMLKCAELEVIYQDPAILKTAITTWSNAEYKIWDKLYKSTDLEYNPIWNVDANTTINDSNNQDDSRTITDSSTDGITNNETNTDSVKGFNENSWAEHEKNVSTGSSSETYANTRSDDYNSEKTGTRTERRTGNIGVTATQDLIKKEREIADFNIINYITESFKNRFCLLVY